MRLPLYHVDAFTSRVFGGNPAGVVPLSSWLPDGTLQAIAAENNLSETAFFVGGSGRYAIRWLTPKTEVDLLLQIQTSEVPRARLDGGREPQGDRVSFDTHVTRDSEKAEEVGHIATTASHFQNRGCRRRYPASDARNGFGLVEKTEVLLGMKVGQSIV